MHRELGNIVWNYCGMERSAAGLEEGKKRVADLREQFWTDVRVVGDQNTINQDLEKAGRVADFMEFAEVMMHDALVRDESCGGHFRTEHQTEEGEAKRDDEHFSHSTAWEYSGQNQTPTEHREQLTFEEVKLTTRSYK
jgi:succinate dehydrogenase / fumarate reductase flavoprotein subunit